MPTVQVQFATLPDPGQATTVDELVALLRMLKVWAGDPSYSWITDRINTAWIDAGRPATESAGKTTVVDCFRPGRRRLNPDIAALAHHAAAYAIAAEIGAGPQQADAQAGLGRTYRALADPDGARHHLGAALAAYTEAGMPEADQVRTDLESLDGGRRD